MGLVQRHTTCTSIAMCITSSYCGWHGSRRSGPLLAACGGSAATPSPTTGAQAQATSAAPAAAAPTAAATPTAEAAPTAAAAEATAAPAAEPTAEGPQAQPTLVAAPNAVVLNYWDMQWGGPELMNQIQDNVTEFNRTHPEI